MEATPLHGGRDGGDDRLVPGSPGGARLLRGAGDEKLVIAVRAGLHKIVVDPLDEGAAWDLSPFGPEVQDAPILHHAQTWLAPELIDESLLLGTLEHKPPNLRAHLGGWGLPRPEIKAVHAWIRDEAGAVLVEDAHERTKLRSLGIGKSHRLRSGQPEGCQGCELGGGDQSKEHQSRDDDAEDHGSNAVRHTDRARRGRSRTPQLP